MYDLAIVVPARRDSSRVINKTMLPFGDAPSLLEWKLRQLLTVMDPARIYLSSEDDEFLGIAARLGVSRQKRDKKLATGHIVPWSEVITGVVREIPHEHIAWCPIVCPLMPPQEYLDAFHRYHHEVVNGPHDSLVGVNMLKEYFWYEGKSLNYHANRDHIPSQDLPALSKVTNSLYMASRATMLDCAYFLGKEVVMHGLSRFSGVDIDYPEDYRIARALHEVYAEERLGAIDDATRIAWPAIAMRAAA